MTQNGYACGFDLTKIAPKYINDTRGTIFVQLMSWVVNLGHFSTITRPFMDVMSSFGIFTTPIISINVVDYFLIRNRKISLLDFYTMSPIGLYWYWHGVNLRTICALLSGVSLGLPGLVYSTNSSVKVNQPMMNVFYGCMFFIPVISGTLYYGLNILFPYNHKRNGKGDTVDCPTVSPKKNVLPEIYWPL